VIYSLGNLAMNTGAKAPHMETASCRALVTSAWAAAGRAGNSAATDASLSRMREASSKKARPRSRGFMWQVPRYDSIATRINTSSADGGGKRSAAGSLERAFTDSIPDAGPRPKHGRRYLLVATPGMRAGRHIAGAMAGPV
jgi:hypothetical protein